jgi:hypothetical protein
MESNTSPISNFFLQVSYLKTNLEKILIHLNREDEVKKLNKHYEKLMVVKKVNSRLIVELFYEHVVTAYAYYILKEDESFFLNKLNDVTVKDDEDLMMISHIKTIWSDLSESVKKNLWMYIKVISFLSEKTTGKTVLEETKLKIN